jgi:hypothetical protein
MGVRMVMVMTMTMTIVRRPGWCNDRLTCCRLAAGLHKRYFDDLNRDMCDLKSVMQLIGCIFQKGIVCMALRHHQVRG